MKSRIIALVALAAGLASCETNQAGRYQGNVHKEWVRLQPGGDVLQVADAKCRMLAQTQAQGMYAQGSAGFVIGAQLGNAIGNAIRIEQFYRQCMTISGWQQIEVRTVPKPRPVVAAQEPAKTE